MYKLRKGTVYTLALLMLGWPWVAQPATPIPKTLQHGSSVLSLDLSDRYHPTMQVALVEWIDHISQALLQVYGRWPRQHWEISTNPVAMKGNGTVPFGQVQRGDIDRIEFYTVAEASSNQLKQSWQGYHEVSHLLIPYRGWGDLWFSEGLATYYQNILQVRAGIIDEQALWQNLNDGFLRGRGQAQLDGIDLKSLSPEMREHRAYMRVYWSGTWYFLAADLALRERSGGDMNLDKALGKLNECCAQRKMSVIEMVRKLDSLNGLTLFYPLYQQAQASTEVPDYEQLFSRLGIQIHKDGAVHLGGSALQIRLRDQISAAKTL